MGVASALQSLLASLNKDEYNFSENRDGVVSTLKEALDDLEQTNQVDFRAIVDNLYDGVFVTDGSAKAVFCNKAYTKLSGIEPEKVLGKYITESERGLWRNAVTPQVLKTRKPVNAIAALERTGTKVLLIGTPVFADDGSIKNVVVILHEMTDLFAIQGELEATREKMRAVEADNNRRTFELEILRRKDVSQSFIGHSAQVREVVKLIRQVADLDATVLIIGETGTGKEVIANEIYASSRRKDGPFIKVNLAALPANLLESELFGYEKGAFTGASERGRPGMFELANKGTILLDEVGEMPVDLQAKLLRAIENREIFRLGGKKPIKLDVRIIASTNRDLKESVQRGLFREDLYYRLNVLPIFLPPLRMRGDDIEELAQHFLKLCNGKYGKHAVLDYGSLEMLRRYPWPGNVREMQNIIERVVIVCEADSIVNQEMIGHLLNANPIFYETFEVNMGLRDIVAATEKAAIERALARSNTTYDAAKLLKIDQSNVVRKARRFGINLAARTKLTNTTRE